MKNTSLVRWICPDSLPPSRSFQHQYLFLYVSCAMRIGLRWNPRNVLQLPPDLHPFSGNRYRGIAFPFHDNDPIMRDRLTSSLAMHIFLYLRMTILIVMMCTIVSLLLHASLIDRISWSYMEDRLPVILFSLYGDDARYAMMMRMLRFSGYVKRAWAVSVPLVYLICFAIKSWFW